MLLYKKSQNNATEETQISLKYNHIVIIREYLMKYRNRKVPIKSVQYMIGHENINMTLGIYADVRIDNGGIIKTMTDFWK